VEYHRHNVLRLCSQTRYKSGTNALAYFSAVSMGKKNVYLTWTPDRFNIGSNFAKISQRVPSLGFENSSWDFPRQRRHSHQVIIPLNFFTRHRWLSQTNKQECLFLGYALFVQGSYSQICHEPFAIIWVWAPYRKSNPGTVFATLHFLCNSRMGPISKIVTLYKGGKAC
jgi:hypothetical protein